MTVKLFAFTCGTVTGEFARLMEGGEGDITLPIPVFLIEHPKGGHCSTPGCTPIASTTPLGGSVHCSPDSSGSAFGPGKR